MKRRGWLFAAMLGVGCGAPIPNTPRAAGSASAEAQGPPPAVTQEREDPMDTLARGDGRPNDAALALGDHALKSGDARGALLAYQHAATLAPNDPAPLVGIARATLAAAEVPSGVNAAPQSEIARAVATELKRATSLDPNYAPAWLELGRTFLVLGRFKSALKPLKNAARLDPKIAEAHSALGIALLVDGQAPLAIEALDRAARMEPWRAERHANLGTAQLAAGKLSDAIISLREAAKLAPDRARYESDIGTALILAGDPGSALPHLRRAVALEPAHASFLSNLGFAFAALGDDGRAIAAFQRATTLDPKLGSAWINLGNALARRRQYAEARAAYDKAKSLDSEDPRVDAVMKELAEIEAAESKGSPESKTP